MNSLIVIQENKQQGQQITIKVKHQEELRRFSVSSSADWTTVISKICSLFSLEEENIVVKYEDDEKELITIGSDAELEEAFHVFLNQHNSESMVCLRLTIFDVPAKSGTTTRAITEFLPEAAHNKCDNNNQVPCQNPWRRGNGGRGCHNYYNNNNKFTREQLKEKLLQLEEKGFKCKGKNIMALKKCDGDIEKTIEHLTNHGEKLKKFQEALQKMQENGFDNRWTNMFLLRKFDGDVDKAIAILTQVKELEEQGFKNPRACIKLLMKFDGDVKKVQEVWPKKCQHYMHKRERKIEKKIKKVERKQSKNWEHKRNKCMKWQERSCGGNYWGDRSQSPENKDCH